MKDTVAARSTSTRNSSTFHNRDQQAPGVMGETFSTTISGENHGITYPRKLV